MINRGKNPFSKALKLCEQSEKCSFLKFGEGEAKEGKDDVNIEVLRHFQEFEHRSSVHREDCKEGEKCEVYSRLGKGGFRRRDRIHSLLFKHDGVNRENGMLRNGRKMNPFTFDK